MSGQSSFPSGLGESSLAGNVITSDRAELRIIGRNPASGLPQSGTPFSLDIEVQTYQGFMQTLWEAPITGWITCPDAIIAVRSADSGRMWGTQRMRTSRLGSCRGQAKLVFHRDFIPDVAHRVVFEIYPEGVDTGNLKNTDLIERSKIMTLDIDQEQGQKAGVYAPPTQPWYELPDMSNLSPGSALGEVNTLLKRVMIAGGVAAGFYFISPMLPGLRDGIKGITSNSNT